MAFKITRNKPESPAATVTVDERVYLDADGKATTDPDEAVRLFASAGAVVPEDEARAVGLVTAKKTTRKRSS